MIIRVYLDGPDGRTASGPDRRGALFCEIHCLGDGTEGRVEFRDVPRDERVETDKLLDMYRRDLLSELDKECHLLGGGMESDGQHIITFSKGKRFRRWTLPHLTTAIHQAMMGAYFEILGERPPSPALPEVYTPAPGFEERFERARSAQEKSSPPDSEPHAKFDAKRARLTAQAHDLYADSLFPKMRKRRAEGDSARVDPPDRG